MIHAWSEMLIDLPVVWDILLRVTVVLSLAWALHLLLVRCNSRWRVHLWRSTSVAIVAVALAALMPKLAVTVSPADNLSVPNSRTELHTLAAPEWASEKPIEMSPHDPWGSILADKKVVSTSAPVAYSEAPSGQSFASWLGQHWEMILGVCWSMGVCVFFSQWLVAQMRVHRLLSISTVAPESCRRVLRRSAGRLELSSDVELRISSETNVPYVTGLRRPVIVLPERMAEPRFAQELPAIFAHELAHIQSHDLVWTGVSQWIAIPLWLHPLTWKMRTVHSMACEEVADAVAAGNVESYSGTLARVALAAVAHPPAAAAIPMARSPEIMSRLARLKQGLSNLPLARNSVVLAGLLGLMALVPLASIEFAHAKPNASQYENYNGAERVLHFPANRSVGMLYIATEKLDSWWETYYTGFDYRHDWDWKYLGHAQGEVTIPAGAKIRLNLQAAGAQDMAWTTSIGPDDLFELVVWHNSDYANAFDFGDAQLRHLAALTGLTELTLYDVAVTDRGLRFLEPLQSLEKIMFHSPQLQGDGLESIGKLAALEVLNLGGMELPDKSLAHLSDLVLLEEIYMPKSKRPGAGFASLMQLPHLKFIRGLDFSNTHLAQFKKCKTLTAVDLTGCNRITNAGVEQLAQVPTLEYINLNSTNITDAGIVRLKPLRSLKQLVLLVNRPPNGPAFSDKGIAVLSQLPQLEHLYLPQIGGVNQSMQHLSQLRKLKHLQTGGKLGGELLNDEGLSYLAKLRNLESLTLSGTHLSNAAGDSLAQLTGLKSLCLISRGMGDDGIAKLNALKNLERLTLKDESGFLKGEAKNSGFTLAGFARLNALTNLKKLKFSTRSMPSLGSQPLDFTVFPQLKDISMRGLRDEDLVSLAFCQKLEWLQIGIRNPFIGDVGLAHIASLKSLTRLTIGGAGVTDEGLVNLVGMDKLDLLTVTGNITDRGLQHIKTLKALQTLNINTRATLSPGAAQSLQASLPSLKRLTLNGDRAGGKAAGNSKIIPLEVGQVAPPFEVKTLKGKPLSLADHQGKVVLLYFWSTNCGPCVASMPSHKEAHKELSKYDDFAWINMSGDNDDATLRRFLRKQRLTWPQVWIGPDSKLAAAYGVVGFPNYILIGRDGKILHVGGGGLDGALRKALDIQGDTSG